MAGAIRGSIDLLYGYIIFTVSRVDTLIRGEGIPGTLAQPKSPNAAQRIGTQLFYGHIITDQYGARYRRYFLRPVMNADNPTLRKLAAQNPSGKMTYADIMLDPKEPVDRTAVMDKFRNDMKNNLED